MADYKQFGGGVLSQRLGGALASTLAGVVDDNSTPLAPGQVKSTGFRAGLAASLRGDKDADQRFTGGADYAQDKNLLSDSSKKVRVVRDALGNIKSVEGEQMSPQVYEKYRKEIDDLQDQWRLDQIKDQGQKRIATWNTVSGRYATEGLEADPKLTQLGDTNALVGQANMGITERDRQIALQARTRNTSAQSVKSLVSQALQQYSKDKDISKLRAAAASAQAQAGAGYNAQGGLPGVASAGGNANGGAGASGSSNAQDTGKMGESELMSFMQNLSSSATNTINETQDQRGQMLQVLHSKNPQAYAAYQTLKAAGVPGLDDALLEGPAALQTLVDKHKGELTVAKARGQAVADWQKENPGKVPSEGEFEAWLLKHPKYVEATGGIRSSTQAVQGAVNATSTTPVVVQSLAEQATKAIASVNGDVTKLSHDQLKSSATSMIEGAKGMTADGFANFVVSTPDAGSVLREAVKANPSLIRVIADQFGVTEERAKDIINGVNAPKKDAPNVNKTGAAKRDSLNANGGLIGYAHGGVVRMANGGVAPAPDIPQSRLGKFARSYIGGAVGIPPDVMDMLDTQKRDKVFTDNLQAKFSKTGIGQSGFGSGLAYGNQDLGQNFACGGVVHAAQGIGPLAAQVPVNKGAPVQTQVPVPQASDYNTPVAPPSAPSRIGLLTNPEQYGVDVLRWRQQHAADVFGKSPQGLDRDLGIAQQQQSLHKANYAGGVEGYERLGKDLEQQAKTNWYEQRAYKAGSEADLYNQRATREQLEALAEEQRQMDEEDRARRKAVPPPDAILAPQTNFPPPETTYRELSRGGILHAADGAGPVAPPPVMGATPSFMQQIQQASPVPPPGPAQAGLGQVMNAGQNEQLKAMAADQKMKHSEAGFLDKKELDWDAHEQKLRHTEELHALKKWKMLNEAGVPVSYEKMLKEAQRVASGKLASEEVSDEEAAIHGNNAAMTAANQGASLEDTIANIRRNNDQNTQVYQQAYQNPQQGFATGGMPRAYENGSNGVLDGPGTTKSDSIPARLSVGEVVLPAEDVLAVGEGNAELGYKRLKQYAQSFGSNPKAKMADGGMLNGNHYADGGAVAPATFFDEFLSKYNK